MAFAPRTLKGQLTLLFLVLTLVPSLTLTVLATHRLLAALERWENPGVQRALEGSLEVAKDLMDRTENDLRQRGQLLAADPALEPPVRASAVRERLATAYNLDVVQLYSPGGDLLFQTTRDPLLESPGPLAGVAVLAADDQPFFTDRDRGFLAYVGYANEPGAPERILVAGIYLEPDFYTRLDDLSRGVAYYRQLGVLKRVNQNAVMLALGLVVLSLALGSTVIARRLAARVSRPVERLGASMERLARGEDPEPVAPAGTAEMEHLIDTFNTMSAELARSRRELARAERLAAWREVARRLAHEMKNALTPITFSLHKIRKTAPALPQAERDRVGRALETLMEEVEGLRRLAASFGELARLPVPEFAPVDLGELARTAAAGLSGEPGGEGGPAVEVEAPGRPLVVDADRTLLRQALTNLLKNAAEASGPAGHVWIRVDGDATLARITVEDDGPGWPPEARETMLEPYFTTKEQGTGLGLSLVQRTVLQHGGSLELLDREGGGARVALSLPGAARARSPEAPAGVPGRDPNPDHPEAT